MIFYLILLFLGLLILQIAYSAYYSNKASTLTREIFNPAKEYGDKEKPPLKLYVDGDSVAAGVGASKFETSATGRLVEFLAKDHHVMLEYRPVSGAKMSDLLERPPLSEKQDLIVLIVSSNDLFHLTPGKKFQESTRAVLDKYTPKTKKLVLVGPGKISAAPSLPLPARLIYNIKEPYYTDILTKEIAKYGNVVYVKPEKPTGSTFAADKFHPNDSGHKIWFEAIKKVL